MTLRAAVTALSKGIQTALADFYIEAITEQALDQGVVPAVADVAKKGLVNQGVQVFFRLHALSPFSTGRPSDTAADRNRQKRSMTVRR